MSKKHGHRGKRRRKPARPSLCPSCGTRPDLPPAALLAALASALNACEEAGVRVRVRHGALFSFHGVIFPPAKKRPWEARPFGTLPVAGTPAEDSAGDGMDD